MRLKVTESNIEGLPVGTNVAIATPQGPLTWILDPNGVKKICQLFHAEVTLGCHQGETFVKVEGFLESHPEAELSIFQYVTIVCK